MNVREQIKKAGLNFFLVLGHVYRPQGIPVLAYHSIDNTNSYLSVAPEIFSMQMGYLGSEGFRVVSLTQLMPLVITGESKNEKIICLTFDDGLRNFYEEAWPILSKHGFSATVFVPTDFIGEKSWWYSQYALTPFPMLGERELRELAANEIDIQSHGCSHRKLTSLPLPEVKHEVEDSKKILEQRMGKSVEFFCYPFGDVNGIIIDAVRNAGYSGGTCMEQGVYKESDDPYLIKRQSLDYIAILDETTATKSIKACSLGTFAWYVKTKQKVIRLFP